MQKLKTISANAFTLNGELLQRVYITYINRAGNVILKNIIYRNSISLGNISNITIDGIPATIDAIHKLVYNFSCECGGTFTPIEDFKIFDTTFNNTFE